MNCLICREADLIDGLTSIAFERDEFRLLIRDVPAWVCPNCGEAVVEEQVAGRLLRQAEDHFAEGIREAVCGYQSAAATDARTSVSSV